MTLDKYLKKASNSVVREKLVNYKVFYEIKLAEARRQAEIDIYLPEIDKDGYDIILNDGDIIKPFQLKVVNSSSKTSSWHVHKNLIRPLPINCNILGYEESPEGDGVEGGFILVNLKVNNFDLEFEYFYIDAYLIKAIDCGLLSLKTKSTKKPIQSLLKGLAKGHRSGKVKLTKGVMFKVKSMDHLLALADLPSTHHNQWRDDFKRYLQGQGANSDLKPDISNKLKELLQ